MSEPKTALNLAMTAFGKVLVTMEPDGVRGYARPESAAFAARKALKAIPADAAEQIVVLKALLRKHGGHINGCRGTFQVRARGPGPEAVTTRGKCTCGWDEARKRLHE